MKEDSDSRQLDAYALKKVTSTRSGSSLSYGESIGGNSAETEREGYLGGFSAGEAAGKEQGLKEVEAKFHFLTAMIEKLKSVEQDLIKSVESDTIQLSLAVAKRIIRQEIQQNPEKIREYVREAMEKMNQSDKFLIRLNPVDKTTLAQSGKPLIQEIEKIKSVRLEADPLLEPGECIIESHAKMVDGRFDSQIALFGEAFFKSLEKK
jgi:flagellar assembly protein FliH